MPKREIDEALLDFHFGLENILRKTRIPANRYGFDAQEYRKQVIGRGLQWLHKVFNPILRINYAEVVLYELPNGEETMPALNLFSPKKWRQALEPLNDHGNGAIRHPNLRVVRIGADYFTWDGTIESQVVTTEQRELDAVPRRLLLEETPGPLIIWQDEGALSKLLKPDIERGRYSSVQAYIDERVDFFRASGLYIPKAVTEQHVWEDHYGAYTRLNILGKNRGGMIVRSRGSERFDKKPDAQYLALVDLMAREMSGLVQTCYLRMGVLHRRVRVNPEMDSPNVKLI